MARLARRRLRRREPPAGVRETAGQALETAGRATQDTVAVAAQTDPEVQSWIGALTPCQKNPAGAACAPAGPGR